MATLGPRQQSVLIAVAAVLLVIFTLAVSNADTVKSAALLERLNAALPEDIANLSGQFQELAQNVRSSRAKRSQTVPEERAEDLMEDPAAFDDSWLDQLSDKTPVDMTALDPGTITWTQEAEDIIVTEIERVQFPPDCSKAKWLAVPMHMGGLMSDVHMFQANIFFGVGHGYTAIPLPNSHLIAYADCIDKSLNCFFKAYTNCSFYDSPNRVEFYKEASIGAPRCPAGKRRGCFAERNIPERLARGELPGDIIAVQMWPHYNSGPYSVTWFDSLFDKLKASGSIQVHGPDHLSHREFMIYSILTKWTMRPVERIQRLANKIMGEFPEYPNPVLGVHVRKTDKVSEDPFYKEHGRFQSAGELFDGIEQYSNERTPRWKSVFMMSDSQAFLDEVLGDPSSLHLGEHVTMLHNRLLNRSVMESGGHNMVSGRDATLQTDHFIAGLYIMSRIADFAMVTFSSNVGRGVLELMAAERRITQISQVGPLADGVDRAWGADGYLS